MIKLWLWHISLVKIFSLKILDVKILLHVIVRKTRYITKSVLLQLRNCNIKETSVFRCCQSWPGVVYVLVNPQLWWCYGPWVVRKRSRFIYVAELTGDLLLQHSRPFEVWSDGERRTANGGPLLNEQCCVHKQFSSCLWSPSQSAR